MPLALPLELKAIPKETKRERFEGRISTILKPEPPWSPTGLALQGEDLYVAEWTNAHSEMHDFRPPVCKVSRDGKVTPLATVPE